MTSNSGMHKPPLAPKPKIVHPQRPEFYTFTRKDAPPLLPTGTYMRVKPALAPKPTLPKVTAGVVSNPSSKADVPKTIGLLNSKNGIQHENNQPDWDYIIPFCSCSSENCKCVGNTANEAIEIDRGLKTLNKGKIEETTIPVSRSQSRLNTIDVKTDNTMPQIVDNSNNLHSVCLQPESTCSPLHKQNHLLKKHSQAKRADSADRNVNTTKDLSNHVAAGRPCAPHRTWSDEVNGNSLGAVDRGPEKGPVGSNHRPPGPQTQAGPLPAAKPRKAALTHREDCRAEKAGSEEKNTREVYLSAAGRESSLPLSVSRYGPLQDTSVSETPLSAMNAFPPPAPMPRKKPFLGTPEKTPASAPRSPLQDVDTEDLGWVDGGARETECSVDGEEVGSDAQSVYDDVECFPPITGQFSQPHRCHYPTALKKDSSSKVDGGRRLAEDKKRAMSEQPLSSDTMTARSLASTLEYPGAPRPGRSSLSKQKAKSFSAADFTHSEGQTKSFHKLLNITLAVKMFPSWPVKEEETTNGTAGETELCVDEQAKKLGVRKLSCPQIGLEQSVDGDEHYQNPGPDSDYEEIAVYEEITDYENLPVGVKVDQQLAVLYDEENIYEEQDPYLPQEQTSGSDSHQQEHAVSGRASAEEAVRHDDTFTSSDEDDNRSSASSKGDPELGEDREAGQAESRPKKSKIHHIATEIMSSESVFVDVLKLLNVDFRDAVSKASHQSGKPVIEERILNQILYYLPQLYELNQDLLKELQQRVAKWDENAQLADIFVKKGPYLKMYSTYIREFDKNVALLDEQNKKNTAFGAVVREFEASPRCANLALRHYLLKPVQRIPQYKLLLTDYLKNLSPDSEDYKDTEAALGIVKEVANHANDTMKQGDNFQKMIDVQSRLTGHHEIVQPGRVFLKEGTLKKLSRKIMQPRMFFLFNDTLFYTTPAQSGQYKLNNMLSLAGMKVSKPSQEAYQNELNIESVERSFILSASSATERDEWLHAISKAISDYTKKKISFISGKPFEETEPMDSGTGSPLGSKAPIWIPDSRTTMCMICTCEFTVAWRRHHCRACGKVVCKACSNNNHSLEYLKNQLARVCDHCFPVLQQRRSEKVSSPMLSPGNKSTFAFSRKQKKIPAALKEVTANTNSSMSGYLQRSKGNKKQGKRLWFVIKDKVLYTYAASEDVAALESQPLLGFVLKEDSSQRLQFKLYHKNTLFYVFTADDNQTAQRWIDSFKEATVL